MTDIAAVIRREHARIRRLLGELDDALADAGLDGPGPAGRLSQSWAARSQLSCVDTALAEYARRAAPRDRDTLHQQWIAYSQVRILGD